MARAGDANHTILPHIVVCVGAVVLRDETVLFVREADATVYFVPSMIVRLAEQVDAFCPRHVHSHGDNGQPDLITSCWTTVLACDGLSRPRSVVARWDGQDHPGTQCEYVATACPILREDHLGREARCHN